MNTKIIKTSIVILIITALSSGCAKARVALPPDLISTTTEIFPEINKDLSINLGDYLLIEQTIERYNTFEIVSDFSSAMPGSMGLPFTFSIEKCKLIPSEGVEEGILYCAPVGKFSASHSMLGAVANNNDQIGIVVSREGIPIKWFVDNSSHNNVRHGETFWDRMITDEEMKGIKNVSYKNPNLHYPYRYLQLISINTPFIKINYVEKFDGNTSELILEVDANSPVIKVKSFEFNIKIESGSSLIVRRIK